MVKILLVEDHNIVRNGIRMLLEMDENITIVAEASNGREALSAIENGLEVDVVLTDINMPEMDGLTLIRELKSNFLHIKVVILSMHDNEKYIAAAFQEGASGYLLKSVNSDELLFTLKHIQDGFRYLCSQLTMNMVNKLVAMNDGNTSAVDFSVREMEVLNLIAEGMTNAEMADKLFISKRTLEGHRQSMMEKTGAKNTASLIRYVVSHGVIQ